jgi:hypothetical protein
MRYMDVILEDGSSATMDEEMFKKYLTEKVRRERAAQAQPSTSESPMERKPEASKK